jgi:hypothetical protein
MTTCKISFVAEINIIYNLTANLFTVTSLERLVKRNLFTMLVCSFHTLFLELTLMLFELLSIDRLKSKLLQLALPIILYYLHVFALLQYLG